MDSTGSLGLAQETFLRLGVLGALFGKHFDSDLPIETDIDGAKDPSHTALPYGLDESILTRQYPTILTHEMGTPPFWYYVLVS